jgi:hypothetical protein
VANSLVSLLELVRFGSALPFCDIFLLV